MGWQRENTDKSPRLGLSLLFQSCVPHKYWVEAFFTANYLSNLLPHSGLSNAKSPYEILHKRSPHYEFLKVFGCTCFPTLRDYATNKFDPRSLKCVFTGYSEKFKGYRCLLPSTGRVYISRHVTFDEQSFTFSKEYIHLHPPAKTTLMSSWFKSLALIASEAQSSPSSSQSSDTDQSSEGNERNAPPLQMILRLQKPSQDRSSTSTEVGSVTQARSSTSTSVGEVIQTRSENQTDSATRTTEASQAPV